MVTSTPLSIRDPVHGFIRADALESALIRSRPLQRLRHVHQLGFAYLVFPGAEHSRFGHALGAMHLAGRLYDSLATTSGTLDPSPRAPARRCLRVAALLHDIGHAPFSHSAEELFEDGIDHEEMTCRLLNTAELEALFEQFGDGIDAQQIELLLKGGANDSLLLAQAISGELDVDKMDYLLRDSLFCGVQYGNYDLERLLDTLAALPGAEDDLTIGVEEQGVHALEALVLARYYMFTQVYFNLTGKVFELHLNEWLIDTKRRWPSDPEAFLVEDDVSVLADIRRSRGRHAEALLHRRHFRLAYESREHLTPEARAHLESELEPLVEKYGKSRLLVSHSAKDPHRLGRSGVLSRRADGSLEAVEEASHFIRHLGRIDRYRIYCEEDVLDEISQHLHRTLPI